MLPADLGSIPSVEDFHSISSPSAREHLCSFSARVVTLSPGVVPHVAYHDCSYWLQRASLSLGQRQPCCCIDCLSRLERQIADDGLLEDLLHCLASHFAPRRAGELSSAGGRLELSSNWKTVNTGRR